MVQKAICSTMSMRRFARVFNVSRTTVKRKIEFLAQEARLNQEEWLKSQESTFDFVQFDDLETFESTKCKPLSVTLFVESEKLKILGFSVSSIGAKGKLSKIAQKKYGKRTNNSKEKRDELFLKLKPYISKTAEIRSDKHPHYTSPIAKHFPDCRHLNYKSRKACVTGQGELKAGGYDPLFNINQTFAMLRDNLKRLSRRTWCTTKKVEALEDQLSIYVDFHNQFLKTKKKKLPKSNRKRQQQAS